MIIEENIQVRDGTGARPGFVLWDIAAIKDGTELMEALSSISVDLLDRDPTEANKAIKIRVDRYREEWLYFDGISTGMNFLYEVFFKIDDDKISIYPIDWVRCSGSSSSPSD